MDERSLRREFCRRALLTVGSALFVPLTIECGYGQSSTPTTQQRPNPNTFQSGDLIWPKTPGKFVPYDSSRFEEAAAAKKDWNDKRQSFVNAVKGDATAPQYEKEAAATIESLEFSQFLALYLSDQKPGIPGEYAGGGSPLYVGHVAILTVNPGGAALIEAVTDRGHKVRSVSYDDWLKERPDDLVWHGRLKAQDSSARSRIAARAATQIGKPYGFWNFDLNDDKEFYCSKLVWQCVFRELNFAVDGNSNAKRGFWFSPKQLMNCASIEMLNVPGSYAHA
jgi:cell wall-associated NlpC family hydrolase